MILDGIVGHGQSKGVARAGRLPSLSIVVPRSKGQGQEETPNDTPSHSARAQRYS